MPPPEGFDPPDAVDGSEETPFDLLEPPSEPLPPPSDELARLLDEPAPALDASPEFELEPLATLSEAAPSSEASSLSDDAAFLYSSLR